MPHHGSIQPILSHDGAAAPAFLPLPPLGSAILKPDLRQTNSTVTIVTSSITFSLWMANSNCSTGDTLFVFNLLYNLDINEINALNNL